jgi:hypothetical protein
MDTFAETIFGLFVAGCGQMWDFGGIDLKIGRGSRAKFKVDGLNAADAEVR